VNVGSVAGIWAYANGSSYVASKFAVHGYTRALREDLFGKPVRVTNIAGGLVGGTEFSQVRFKGDEEKAASVYANVGLGGPLQPEDIAECILFAVTRPPRVSIDEMLVLARAQTTGVNVYREQ
jgi:NADP-dependent 3-hydroxy acid dehydrogenase YdfG